MATSENQRIRKVRKKPVRNSIFFVKFVKNTYMTNSNYLEAITKQSQEKFNLMKERMLEPIKQVQQARQESLRNLLKEIESKQHLLQEKRVNLEKLCQG